MAVKPIIDNHHVVRHCKSRLVRRENGKILGVFPELFQLREAAEGRKQETYLSALYYEHFTSKSSTKLYQCCSALTIKPKPKDVFACISAGLVRSEGKKQSKSLRVTHEPTNKNPAYAAIRGIPITFDPELSSLLAEVATIEAIEYSQITSSTEFSCGL